jgi:superfamily II RNA helicase
MKIPQSRKEELDTIERLRSMITEDVTAVQILVQYGELEAEKRRLYSSRRHFYAKRTETRGTEACEKLLEKLSEITHKKLLVSDAIGELMVRGRAHLKRVDQVAEALKCDAELVEELMKATSFPETLPVLLLTGSYWQKALGPGQ